MMTSELLNELRVLSAKFDDLQKDIIKFQRKVSEHLVDDRGSKGGTGNTSLIDGSSCHEDGDSVFSKEIRPESRQSSLNPNAIASKYNEASNQESDEFGTRADKTVAKQPIVPKDKSQTKERTSSYRNMKGCREECMRKALQQNIVSLVDNLPYSEDDILDMLIENECLTETECSDIRNNTSRKDRVRNLVRIIKGRTFKVIKTFIDCVKMLHPEVAASILQVYEKLLKDKKNYNRQCTFCVLKRSTDIKFVADHIWSIGAISDELYDEIVEGRTDKEILWAKFAEECNKSKVRRDIIRKLSDALMIKAQYHDLVMKLSKLVDFRCACVAVNASGSRAILNPLVPEIVILDSEENSTVSPVSTPTSCRSYGDDPDIESEDENYFVNRHENYFLSPWTSEREKLLYTSCVGIRKCSAHALSVVDEFRKVRSNSFGKKTSQGNIRQQRISGRRASMFM